MARRIVGMDLGIVSAHHAVVIDETCAVVGRARAYPTVESLGALERRALEGAPEGTVLDVVIDPTGPAWLPVAVFFAARGHRVYRPSVEQTAHLRRGLAKRKKTNRIDAEVLAKLAVWNAEALHELELPAGEAAELDRVVRTTERLTEEVAAHKLRTGDHYASYVGLVPGSSETGETDRKGQPMTKAGNRKLRRMFVRAADTARKFDPELPRIYWIQMVERGAHHNKALSVVAAHLARRFWATMVRGTPYVVRDTDGRPVSRTKAKAIVAERYTVPEEVRARRRSKKKRRAVPHQVLVGHVSAVGPQGATQPRRRPSAPVMVAPGEEVVNTRS